MLALVGAAFLALPIATILWRAPWSRLGELLASEELVTTLRLSLFCSLWATALSALVGIPLAWLLARGSFRGKRFLRGLVILPVVLPPVIAGLALITAFGRSGVMGRWLFETFDVSLPFTTAGTILAETFVAMPFLVLAVEGALRSTERGYEDAAATLGAGSWTVFRRVTLPAIAPALLSGALLAWARAIGEFGATITFAGNLPGATRTIPLAAFFALQREPEAAIALSLVLVAVSLGVLIGLRDRWLVRA
ncbi:MAG: molybdate ABC transporter permease subunit [Actinobacteria bacterium]|nr:molybdate ABC transporter permease subunit [Actinomycetota bacterium]